MQDIVYERYVTLCSAMYVVCNVGATYSEG